MAAFGELQEQWAAAVIIEAAARAGLPSREAARTGRERACTREAGTMSEEKPPEDPKGPKEFVDEALRNGEDKKEVDRLAKLTVINFEHEREKAAKKLGVRKPILDKVVAAARP